MPGHKLRCTWYACCKQLKAPVFSIAFTCDCNIHKGRPASTIYLFDKRLSGAPIYREYANGREPKNLALGTRGYYLMSNTPIGTHLLTPAGPTWCGILPDTDTFKAVSKTTIPLKASCPKCQEVLSHLCYCVCHSPTSSRGACEHCLGQNNVVYYQQARQAGKTTEALKQIYLEVANEVADEYYPKGHPRRGEYLRDMAVMFAKLQPKLVQLLGRNHYISKQKVRDLMSTHQIIQDIKPDEQRQTSPLHKNEVAGGQHPKASHP